jgi:integrase
VPNRIRLTDLSLRSLKFSDTQVTYWDETQRAFGVRVGRRSKTFVVVVDGGRRLKVGTYPDMKLQDARKMARQLLSDPASQARRRTISVEQAVILFLETRAQKNRPSTKAETERLLRRHLLPDLARSQLSNVNIDEITAIIDELLDTPATANHVFTAMRTFFNWCVARRYLKHAPTAGLTLPAKPGKRERVLSEKELATIYRAALKFGYPYGVILLICIHTGMRRGEVAALKWSYVTPQHITIPTELAKNGQEHVLPNLIGDLFRGIPRTSEYLFPSGADTPFSAWSKTRRKFDKTCAVTGWVIHDLRRTFSTKMAEWQLAPPHVIERILNHTVGSMTPIARVYNRWNYLAEMKEAMQRYEIKLAQALAAHDPGVQVDNSTHVHSPSATLSA